MSATKTVSDIAFIGDMGDIGDICGTGDSRTRVGDAGDILEHWRPLENSWRINGGHSATPHHIIPNIKHIALFVLNNSSCIAHIGCNSLLHFGQ
jgi:hypothetical protein